MFSADEIIRRLKPLLGKQADAIWQAYLISEPEERRLIQHALENLHAAYIDDYRNAKIILTPPTTFAQLHGNYPVGTVWYADTPLYPFAFLERELVQHLGVFGRTGAGKSFFIIGLITHIIQRHPVHVLDWKGTYRGLRHPSIQLLVPGSTTHAFHFNPLDLDGIEQEQHRVYLRQVIELFIDCYLADLKLLTVQGVEYLLMLALDDLYPKEDRLTFFAIFEWIKRFEGKFREMDWKTSALNILYKLITSPLGRTIQGTTNIAWLVKQRTIFELNQVGNESDKSFFIRTLLLRLYYHFQDEGATNAMRLFIVIEEAHNILLRREYETIIERMLRQVREFGVGICIVDQHPSLISLPALGTYTTVAFNLRLQEDRDSMASALNLEQAAYLGRLPPRFAIVKIQDRFLTPFLIRTHDVNLEPGKEYRPPRISEQAENRNLQKGGSKGDRQVCRARSGFSGAVRALRNLANGEKKEGETVQHTQSESRLLRIIRRITGKRDISLLWEEALMIHLYLFPLTPTTARYRDLALNNYQGNKHKIALLKHQWISIETVSTFYGRIKLLTPTDKGFYWLQSRGFCAGRSDKPGGMQHQYWKRRLRAQFRKKDCKVDLEFDLGNNSAVDVMVERDGRYVGVEIETGKNSYRQILANIEKCLGRCIGVVSFILDPAKGERIREQIKKDSRIAVVIEEGRCIDAVMRLLGDAY